jgi:L-2,4-diaminobutyrate decarboxylase
MHVDGAHGMGVILSEKHRNKVKGIERADSVVIDFHKMLLVPALNTLVMFRDGEKSYETFAQKASYLFNKSQKNLWYNSATRTIECTKSSLGVVAYTALKYYGDDYLRQYIDSRYDITSELALMLGKDERFELAMEPESNIICFRYCPRGVSDEATNRLNAAIRDRIIKEGSFYIVQAEIGGKIFLRLTIINPLTSMKELGKLIETIVNLSEELTQ